MKSPTIYFLEGLPGTGKTTILNSLPSIFTKIPEVLDQDGLALHHNKLDQRFFMQNDEDKVHLALSASKPTFVERSPLGTLLFNVAKKHLNPNHDLTMITNWYEQTFVPLFRPEGPFRFIILDISPVESLKRKKRNIDQGDPWANPKSLAQIRKGFLKFARDNSPISTLIDSTLPEKDKLNIVSQISNG